MLCAALLLPDSPSTIADLLYCIINMDTDPGRIVVSNSSILSFKEFKLWVCSMGTDTRRAGRYIDIKHTSIYFLNVIWN